MCAANNFISHYLQLLFFKTIRVLLRYYKKMLMVQSKLVLPNGTTCERSNCEHTVWHIPTKIK